MGQILLLHLIAHCLPPSRPSCLSSLPASQARSSHPDISVYDGTHGNEYSVCDGSQWQGSHCPHPLADRLSCILLE